MPKSRVEYNDEWTRENCDSFTFRVPKGKLQLLKDIAETHDTSVNKLLIKATEEKYSVDLSKPKYKKRKPKEL